MEALVSAVRDEAVGSTLISQAGTVLVVEDPDEFAGYAQLRIGDEVSAYELVGGELHLPAALVGAYAEDEPVLVHPEQVERIALLVEAGGEEEIEASVPHALHDRLATGTRAEDEREVVKAEYVADELELVDVVARSPRISGGFVDAPHDDTPIATGAVLGASYTVTGDSLTIVPDEDSLATVTFDVTVQIDGGSTVLVSLLVDGVQNGSERRLRNGGTVQHEIPVSGSARVEMAAGVEYVLEVAGKLVAGPGATILGSKSGGLGYALNAG